MWLEREHYIFLHQPWQCCQKWGPSLLCGVVGTGVSSLNLSRRGGEGWSGKWDTFLAGNALSGDLDMDSDPDYTTCSFTHWLLWISVVDKIRISAPFQRVAMIKSYDKPRQCIKRQRHHFADKDLLSQGYGLSSSHVWMWELLDHKEGWVPKNWCFWTVVLEKTLESLGQQEDTTSQS